MTKLLSKMNRYLLTALMLCTTMAVFSQLQEDFNDGNISQDPEWTGDIASFTINEDLQLQLSTSGSGTSTLLTSVDYPSSAIWELDLLLDFSPSSNNNVTIYLYIDQQDINLANGYALKIGENGADDTVELFAVENGDLDLIGSGQLGIFATDPVETGLQVIRDTDGNWSISSDLGRSGTFFREFDAFDDRFDITGQGFFGVHCKFTTSNADGFIFDNISIAMPVIDNESPKIQSITIEDDQSIIVQFDEQLVINSATNPAHYSVSMIGQAISAELIDERNSTYRIQFSQSFQNGSTSELTTTNIEDISGNVGGDTRSFEILIPEIPVAGDILINEILYDPPTNGVDFVEIINVSNKIIALNELSIINTTRSSGAEQMIESNRIILPSEIIAFTSKATLLERDYVTEVNQIVENTLPQFVIDGGNVSIAYNGTGGVVLLDSFNYNESFHNSLLSETKGVSLERISTSLESIDKDTWQSAGSIIGFATPGYKNSQETEIVDSVDDILSFENLTFSPNNDGDADFLLIRLQPDVQGSVGRVRIYNAQGHLVRNLVESALLSTSNFVKWTGTDNDGVKSRIGPYIVRAEYVDDMGRKTVMSKTCVLADHL